MRESENIGPQEIAKYISLHLNMVNTPRICGSGVFMLGFIGLERRSYRKPELVGPGVGLVLGRFLSRRLGVPVLLPGHVLDQVAWLSDLLRPPIRVAWVHVLLSVAVLVVARTVLEFSGTIDFKFYPSIFSLTFGHFFIICQFNIWASLTRAGVEGERAPLSVLQERSSRLRK